MGATPRSVAISADSSRIFVSRYISSGLTGEVVEVNAATMTKVRSLPLGFDPGPDHAIVGRGLPNYIGQMAISPDGTFAIVPSKKDNIGRGLYQEGRPLTFESQVRPITSRLN